MSTLVIKIFMGCAIMILLCKKVIYSTLSGLQEARGNSEDVSRGGETCQSYPGRLIVSCAE